MLLCQVGGGSLPQGWKDNTCSLVLLSVTTTYLKMFPLQDSITTWLFTGISLSKSHGETRAGKAQPCRAADLLLLFKRLLSFRHLC